MDNPVVRVMVLDDLTTYLRYVFEEIGLQYVVVYSEVSNELRSYSRLDDSNLHSAYQAIKLIREANKKSKSSDIDLIIIGNNMGAGVDKARALTPEACPKTIVVWNDYLPGTELPYAELGYRYFASRADFETIKRYISEILEAQQAVS
jgi:hypothetical protein